MIIINIILAVAQLAGGVVSAYYAAEWGVDTIIGISLASTAVSVYYINDLLPIFLQCRIVPIERLFFKYKLCYIFK